MLLLGLAAGSRAAFSRRLFRLPSRGRPWASWFAARRP